MEQDPALESAVRQHLLNQELPEDQLKQIEEKIDSLKGDQLRSRAVEDARGIAYDMGLEYIRTLSAWELNRMAGNNLTKDVRRSFRNADLVIEASKGNDAGYVVMEISFNAGQKELDRVLRNAGLISRFTGKQAYAAIGSVKNSPATAEASATGKIYWHPLEDRTPDPE